MNNKKMTAKQFQKYLNDNCSIDIRLVTWSVNTKRVLYGDYLKSKDPLLFTFFYKSFITTGKLP